MLQSMFGTESPWHNKITRFPVLYSCDWLRNLPCNAENMRKSMEEVKGHCYVCLYAEHYSTTGCIFLKGNFHLIVYGRDSPENHSLLLYGHFN